MKLTVTEVLSFGTLMNSTILAGSNSLERTVTGVQLWDQDAIPENSAGKLLVWPMADSKISDLELVERAESAAKHEAASLILSLSSHRPTVPDSAEIAEKLAHFNLPILCLALGKSSFEVIHRIEGELLERVMKIVERADLIHRELTLTAISGGDLHELTAKLADLLENPVSIRNMRFEVLSDASGGSHIDEARRRSIAEGRVTDDVRQALERYDFDHRLRTERGPFRLPAIPAVGMQARALAPIRISEVRYGYISIAECTRALGAIDMVAVETAALIAALILSHHQALVRDKARLRASFANELIFGMGDLSSAHLLNQRAKTLGYRREHFVVFAIGLEVLDRLVADPKTHPHQLTLLQEQLAVTVQEVPKSNFRLDDDRRCSKGAERHKEQAHKGHQRSPLVLSEHDGLVVILPIRAEAKFGNASKLIDHLKQFAAKLVYELELILGKGAVWIGIGRPYSSQNTRKSYLEARQALTISRLVPGQSTTYYEEMGVYRLIAECADTGLLGTFTQEQIGALVEYDEGRGGDLVRTLRLYLECGGNKAKTAALLPSHLNTVKYRLQQIADLTGHDPDDPEQQLCYGLALKILDLHY